MFIWEGDLRRRKGERKEEIGKWRIEGGNKKVF